MTYSETTWGYVQDETDLDKWNDVLVSYAGNAIFTDTIGNTIWDGLFYYTWQHGRQLASAQSSIVDVTYSYNADGIRTSKTVKNTISNTNILHTYDLSGSSIVRECIYDTNGSYVETELRYYYDAKGAPTAMRVFKRTSATATAQEFVCYFATNLQGDVVALYDEDGNCIASYTYDAWGNNIHKNSTATSNISASDAQWLMNINPFRYRGYYYDTDTGLYYLQSRYYNPIWGRFINADSHINANGDLIGFNMYAYCSNNPVMYTDISGNSKIADWAIKTLLESKPAEWAMRIYAEILADSVNACIVGKSNTDAQAIAEANWYSYYDDTLVVHNPIKGLSSFAIGNTIVLSTKFKEEVSGRDYTLKHERGHIEQEQELGAVKYFVSVAIPSVIYCGFSKAMKKLGVDYFSDIYHSMPWEYKANELNSNTGNEQPWAQDWSDKYYAFWKGEE